MKKKILSIALVCVLAVSMITGCSSDKTKKTTETTAIKPVLKDGFYSADFKTDSKMFHVNETKKGKGILSVKNGGMTVHISLVSKRIVNLFPGRAADAKKDGAKLLQPTVDKIKYSDGTEDEVFGFDVPVKSIGKEFDLAILGSSGKWFDHKVSVSNPKYIGDKDPSQGKSIEELKLKDGTYTAKVTLNGGSGRASVDSPCKLEIKDKKCFATITWGSKKYDFMMVNDKKYLPINKKGNSTFKIPVDTIDAPVFVQADTVAMSKPYLIDYTLLFENPTLEK